MRVIAATNKDLAGMVADGKFRDPMQFTAWFDMLPDDSGGGQEWGSGATLITILDRSIGVSRRFPVEAASYPGPRSIPPHNPMKAILMLSPLREST